MPVAAFSTPSSHKEQDTGQPPPCSLFVTSEWFDLLEQFGLPPNSGRIDAYIEQSLRLPLMQNGKRLQALSNYYTGEFGLVGGAAPSAQSMQQLALWFREQAPRQIELRPLHEAAPLLSALTTALHQNGFYCDEFYVSTNWHLPCAGLSWADYLASRPSRLANTLRRCRKRLEAMPGFRLEIVTKPTRLDQALADYARVYAQSWKDPEPFPDFIPQLCRMSATQDWLRLGVLYVGDEPAAAQVWFVKDGTASIYKLAYDSRFAKLGVGTVLTAALTEYVLDVDKVSEIDFLTGDDAYKAEWMTHSRKLVGLIAFNKRSPLGLLQAARHFGMRWLRTLFKRSTP